MTPTNTIFSFFYLTFWDYYTNMTFLAAKESQTPSAAGLKGTSGSSCPKSWIGTQLLNALIQQPGERKENKKQQRFIGVIDLLVTHYLKWWKLFLLSHITSFILNPLYSADSCVQKSAGWRKQGQPIDYSYYLLNPHLSLQSEGHSECNKTKGAKFTDMFTYVFMANKSFPINEQVNGYVIKTGVPNCLLD